MEQCKKCLLPEDLCVCGEEDKDVLDISVRVETRTHNRKVTIVEFEDSSRFDESLDELASSLKKEFACGGTAEKGCIELQGNHEDRVKKALEEKVS